MGMLVGEMGANYFITIFEHLAAMKEGLRALQLSLCKDAGDSDGSEGLASVISHGCSLGE